MCGHPFAPIQILTVDTRKGCVFRCGWLLDERRSFQRKPCIERRFESSPGVQRVATLWGTFGSFRTSEKNKNVSLSGVSRFSKPRSSSPQWRFRTNKIKTFPKGESRFCKPRFSLPQWRLRINKIKTFPKGRFEVLQTSNQPTQTTTSH